MVCWYCRGINRNQGFFSVQDFVHPQFMMYASRIVSDTHCGFVRDTVVLFVGFDMQTKATSENPSKGFRSWELAVFCIHTLSLHSRLCQNKLLQFRAVMSTIFFTNRVSFFFGDLLKSRFSFRFPLAHSPRKEAANSKNTAPTGWKPDLNPGRQKSLRPGCRGQMPEPQDPKI